MKYKKTFKRTKLEKRLALKKIAIQFYKRGFTTREIASKIGRSHGWVALVEKEFEKDRKTSKRT